MSDDLVKRWVPCYAEGDYDNPPEMEEDPYGDYVEYEGYKLASNRIAVLEAKLAKAVEALTVIDALDPEGLINGCSQSALVGLVLRMGGIARATLVELKGQDDE